MTIEIQNRRPIIVVAGPDKKGTMAWIFTAANIILAKGKPLRVQPKNYTGPFDFDGIIFGGGANVHPDLYNCPQKNLSKRTLWVRIWEKICFPLEFLNSLGSKEGHYDQSRDAMELSLLNYALKSRKPILGICRGHQFINAILGGGIQRSTLPYYETRPRIRTLFPRKKISLNPQDTTLSEIFFQKKTIWANALHNQCLSRTGEDMIATGTEESGIIQASEGRGHILTVQWHPEYLIYMKSHRRLFSWLVKKTKAPVSRDKLGLA